MEFLFLLSKDIKSIYKLFVRPKTIREALTSYIIDNFDFYSSRRRKASTTMITTT